MTILNGYATLAEFLSRYAPNSASDAARDISISANIQAMSRLIDLGTGRQFYPSASQARTFQSTQFTNEVHVDDMLTCSKVEIDMDGDGTYETTLTLGTDYILMPDNASYYGAPYTWIEIVPTSTSSWPTRSRGVRVTGTWGYCGTGASVSDTRIITAQTIHTAFVDDLVSIASNGLATDDNDDGTFETVWNGSSDYTLTVITDTPTTWIQTKTGGAQTFPITADGVQITGLWTSIGAPDLIKEACYLLSYRLYERKATPFGITGSAEMGVLVAIAAIDPDAVRFIAPYIKAWGYN